MNSRKVDLARQRLPSSGRLAELVLESSADLAVLTICLDGVITSWNSAAERVMGWSGEEAVGRHACMIFTPEDEATDACSTEMATARRCGWAVDERWHLRKDGTRFWGSGSMTRLEDHRSGEQIGYVKIVQDRTEQHLAGERLRTSEALLRGVFANSADSLKLLTPDGCLTSMNGPGLRMLEIDGAEHVRGKEWGELWPEEERGKVSAALAEALAGQVGRFHGFRPTVTGAPRWWDVQVTAVPGSDGRPELLLASSRDVTERERSREALRLSEERFRALVAASTATVWTTDANGLVREDSPSWRAFTGQALEQWLGTGWADAVHPDDRVRAAEEWAAAVAAGTMFNTEYRLCSSSGEWRLVTARGVPVRNGDGSIREWVGTNTDITAQRRGEEARRVIEEHCQLAVRATNDAIWDWDLRCDRVEWNEALQETYGHRSERVCPSGAWWLEQVHPEDRERVSRSIHAVIDGGGDRWSDEYRFRRADGGYADVLDRGFMVRGPGGEPLRMIGAMLDITARRQSERELRRLNEHLEVEVSRRTEQLRLQEEALRQSQKLEAVGQLTGGVAHDFNNLLTVIRSSAGLLRRSNLPEERRRRYVEAIAETAERAAKLTGQLLAFARRQPLRPEVFVVGDRVRSVVELVRPLVGAPVTIETSIECEGRAVEADPNQFETALVNLAVNARDAMESGGHLRLRTWLACGVPPTRGHAGTRGSFVAVSVSDTGVGIEPELLGRIFEPFFTTKEAGKGTGLGLSQVYGFAKQSGGELHVESEVGRGSTFTLYLPQAEGKPVVAPMQPAEGADAPADGRRNVLLVEDNTQVGEFARQMLEDLGYVPSWAPNAKAALELLEGDASRFDVVFSDVVMPGMNGIELGKEIRRRWPNLPVVLTSGYSHVLANDGAQGFELLNKPYSAEELSRVLRSSR
ncbi:PAS domain S-box protein [Muricoccus aerilatus]|uniref:PAS domain-containing hybrid sensor histidine kinase/response regulator n=1 Tax=Muricoccus aerilatus TaxID=452982 RepID=UPI000A4287AB|nr:PAS domain S-box protein [Roseomonas aerilata]